MLFFGLDIGTSNIKAVLLNREGELLDRFSFCSHCPSSSQLASVQSWCDGFSSVMDYFSSRGGFDGKEITGSVTAQGGSFVFVDHRFHPITPISSWTQSADRSVVNDMIRCFGKQDYYHQTGWEPSEGLAACKMKEMVDRNQIPEQARYIASVCDYVYSKITGQLVSDITSSQMTGVCNLTNGQWNRDIINWTGINDDCFPDVVKSLAVLYEKTASSWGKINLVTGSFDQYAAMEAVGLKPDSGVMLGTGTAWVINGRSSEPLFDDETFGTHPGKDIAGDHYGFIVGLGSIGKGFDALLKRLDVDVHAVSEIEVGFEEEHLPASALRIDLEKGLVECEGDKVVMIRRYMEWVCAWVAFKLERLQTVQPINELIMTGGAARSRFWPQVIADVCGIKVKAVDFPELTAYGAALHAMKAMGNAVDFKEHCFQKQSIFYEPSDPNPYRRWYLEYQRPALVDVLQT